MVEYGIRTSEAFIWAHVCPLDASIYWYQRTHMLEVLPRCTIVEIRSARGHLVPLKEHRISWIKPAVGFIHDCELGYEFFKQWEWTRATDDRQVGEFAEECFALAVKKKRLTLPVNASRVEVLDEQFKGKDFECRAKYAVEVKADIPGGLWGTGNLFVQTAELAHQHGRRNGHRGMEIAP